MADRNQPTGERDLQSALGRIVLYNEEIESLKTKLHEKDEEISRLRREVMKLRTEVARKGQKFEQLENRIQEIEHDKTDLQTKLCSVETKLCSVETKLCSVTKEVTWLKQENEKLSSVTKEVTWLKQDNESLRQEIKNVKETLRIQTSSLSLYHSVSRKRPRKLSFIRLRCAQGYKP